jgi:hypothetical protein
MTNKTSLSAEHALSPLSGFGSLLHPGNAFCTPSDVVSDSDLTLNEKRAILAAWASDACAVEAAPSLRSAPGGTRTVPIDDILRALCELDKEARSNAEQDWANRQVRRQRVEDLRPRTRTVGRRPRPVVAQQAKRRAG